jgi:hypothetical protein
MKRTITWLAVFICLICNGIGESIRVDWNPNLCDPIIGYKIYYGITTHTNAQYGAPIPKILCNNKTNTTMSVQYDTVFSSVITVYGITNTSVIVTNLVANKYYFFEATTFDSKGAESPFSSQFLYKTSEIYTNGSRRPILMFDLKSDPTHRTMVLKSDMYIVPKWTILKNNNLATTNWYVYATGSNSLINLTITNTGTYGFFRLKI